MFNKHVVLLLHYKNVRCLIWIYIVFITRLCRILRFHTLISLIMFNNVIPRDIDMLLSRYSFRSRNKAIVSKKSTFCVNTWFDYNNAPKIFKLKLKIRILNRGEFTKDVLQLIKMQTIVFFCCFGRGAFVQFKFHIFMYFFILE